MFVRKSTHDAVLAELSGVKAANRLLIVECDRLQRRLTELDRNYRLGKEQYDTRGAELRQLRAELATTYVRDSKGRMARHPSATK